jgi:hypothetical protein
MPSIALLGVSVLFGLIAWGTITRLYIWPALSGLPCADALRPILALHCFRFVGLAFLIPGVVSPELPPSFAGPAAYGDLATATLALLALSALRSGFGTTAPTILVPLLLVTHGLVFRLLLRREPDRVGRPAQ